MSSDPVIFWLQVTIIIAAFSTFLSGGLIVSSLYYFHQAREELKASRRRLYLLPRDSHGRPLFERK
jgi:hypothetical protein